MNTGSASISPAMNAILSQGDAYLANGDPGKALDSYSSAIRIDDRCTAALIRIGDTLMRLQRPEEAIHNLELAHLIDESDGQCSDLLDAAYQHICEVGLRGRTDDSRYRANCLDAIFNIGELYRLRSRNDKTIAALKKLLLQYPRSAMLLYKLGSAYRNSGDLDNARRHYARAIKLAPDFAEASAGLAMVHERLGETDKGLKVIARFNARGTDNAAITLTYAKLQQQQGNSRDGLEQIERMLASGAADRQSTILLHFQAGKMYDSIKEYDRAFEHFRQGNELKATDFNPATFVRTIDETIATWTRARLDRQPHLDNDSERPIFIVGMPRSATSLTEQILASHSAVHPGGESRALLDVETVFKRDIDNADLAALARQYEDDIGYPADTNIRVTDKMMFNYKRLHLVELLYPNARIIHCTRNPLDNCLSIYINNFSGAHSYSNRLEDLALYYRQYRRLMEHWTGMIRNPVYTLSYEDLVADPDNQVRELIDFCGLPWEDRCLKFFESKRYVHTASYDQVRKPIYTKSVERWRNYAQHLQPLIDGLA